MTTIAVCGLMMAADSALVRGEDVIQGSKLRRMGDWIVGASGDCDLCDEFFDWAASNPRGKPKLKLRKDSEFDAIVLTREGRIILFDGFSREPITEDFAAVGSGHPHAMTAMDTMRHYGQPVCPQMAIVMAAKRDRNTRLPVSFLTWRQ